MTKAESFHRSAIEPVGIVSAVSMKTIWKRKIANAETSYETPVRKKPVPPKRPHRLPPTVGPISFDIPSGALSAAPIAAPEPPIWMAYPAAQKPRMPSP